MQAIASETAAALLGGRGKLTSSHPDLAIEIRIREFVAHNLLFNENGYPHEDGDSFLQHGVIDSLGVVELVTFVGREFGVQVEPAEITPENFDSVRQLADFIRRKRIFMTEGEGVAS